MGAYSAILCLGDEEIDDSGLYSTPDGEDNIGPPSDLIHGNRPGELIQEASGSDSKTREAHSLCTHFKREDLDRIQCLERSEAY